MLYHPEVGDDFSEQEILSDIEEEKSSNIEIIKTNDKKQKKSRKLKARSGGFAADFHFDAGDNETIDTTEGTAIDHLDGLRQFLKQNSINKTNLDEKIKQERQRIRAGQTNGDEMQVLKLDDDSSDNGEQLGESDDECALLPESTQKEDRVKVKLNKKAPKGQNDHFFDDRSKQLSDAAQSAHQLTFDDLNLSRPLIKTLSEAGFIYPTPIQTACIPVALAGSDVCACSATGTGKTAAFMLPILERLLFRPRTKKSVTRVLVLVPTRELAIQVFQVSRQLSKYNNVGICLAAGGLDLKAQEAAIRLGLDIVIATPGRLIDLLHNCPTFSLADIEVLVLDEADRMLDQQFTEQMKEIIRFCSRKRQTMLFSATMTEQVEDLANLSLNKPVKLFINENTDTAQNLHQEFVRIRHDRKNEREAYVASLITRNFPDHSIVFVRTKQDCERMHVLLGLFGVKVGKLHGGLTQVQRVECLYAFKRQQNVEIICATDLAARGLDIEGVTTIINMHMPNTLQHYVHRVGRTARAGKAGRSISLVGEQDRKLLKEIAKANRSSNSIPLMQRNIEPEVIESYIQRINELEPSIDKLIEEEKVDKQLLIAEKSIKKAEAQVKLLDKKMDPSQLPKPRKWIGGKETPNKPGKQRIRSKGRRREERKRIGMQQTQKSNNPIATSENKAPKGRKKSTFSAEITDISHRTVKRLRYGPDDVEFKRAKKDKQKSGAIRQAKR